MKQKNRLSVLKESIAEFTAKKLLSKDNIVEIRVKNESKPEYNYYFTHILCAFFGVIILLI